MFNIALNGNAVNGFPLHRNACDMSEPMFEFVSIVWDVGDGFLHTKSRHYNKSQQNIVYLKMSCMWFENVVGNIENLMFLLKSWDWNKKRIKNVFFWYFYSIL